MTQEEFYEAAFTELKAIEAGKATLELTAGDILLGRVEYLTNNGWSIIVFSDGDDWDYVDAIIPPSGEHFALWPEKGQKDCEEMRRLRSYRPPDDQLRKVWGFLT